MTGVKMPETRAPQALPDGVNPKYVIFIDGVYYDRCVMCMTVTDIPTNCRIERRAHYVEGCGQLCKSCWDKTDSRA